MAVWLNTLAQQPLELDYLLLDVPGAERTVEKAGFLQNAAFFLLRGCGIPSFTITTP